MKRIPAYLTDEEIARKITECVSSATGMIVKSIIEKSGRIIALRRLYRILLIRRYVRLSIMKNARRYVVARGPWEMAVIYCKKNGCLYTIMREKRLQNCKERRQEETNRIILTFWQVL